MGEVLWIIAAVYLAPGALLGVLNIVAWRDRLNLWRGAGVLLACMFLWPEVLFRRYG